MNEFDARFANLSPAKRKLLELRLKQKKYLVERKSAIPRSASAGPVPLSFGQRRQWFLYQLEPENPVYNKTEVLLLRGPLDVPAFKAALEDLIARHEVLHTTYRNTDFEPVQIVNEHWSLDLPVVDLSHLSSDNQELKLQTLIEDESQRPFDLSRDLMIRHTLFRLSPGEHVLMRVTQHIASDKWSAGILNREVSILYDAHRAGQPPSLPDLPIQYADFALWQRASFEGEQLQKQVAFWLERLQNAPTALNLPADHPRPEVQTHHGAVQTQQFSSQRVEALKSFSRQNGVTLFMTLFAAFNVLLYRYSGQEDILVGVPVAGRSAPETEGLIGLFINTLVLRSDLSGEPTFKEFVTRIRQFALEAFAHQDLPFEILVEQLNPERNLDRTPLFQVMFDYLNTPTQELELTDIEISQPEHGEFSAIYDLSLYIREESGQLTLAFEYNTDIFEDATIGRMLGHFEMLINSILENPETPVSQLTLLTEYERQLILSDWQNTQTHYRLDLCIHQLFEQQSVKTPDNLALIYEDQRLTYRELNRHANQLAHHLHRLGVKSNTIVAIFANRSLETITGLLGVLKAGGAYLPLDPSYPQERLDFMLQDSQAAFLLTQPDLIDQLPPYDGQILFLEESWQRYANEPVENPSWEAYPDNLMYVIYTSGSTGIPKGVSIAHRSVMNFVQFASQYYQLHPGDRVLQFASLNFDTAIEEIFPALSLGAAVVLKPQALSEDFIHFMKWVAQQGISVLDLPTALWHAWISELNASDSVLPASLRLLIVGGEKAYPEDYQCWRDHFGNQVRWVNTYGPTEATVVSLVYEPDEHWGTKYAHILPIGRPISNAEAYILDWHLNPVPVGVPGELYLAGEGLAQGYLNRPDLTADRFLLHQFPQDDSGNFINKRIYKTGDIARYLANGEIEYLGRSDHQVKLRGYRIELEEIETILRYHPLVKEVAVLAQEIEAGEWRLIAYVVHDADEHSLFEALRNHLRLKLPLYMMPNRFVSLDQVPLTPNGKIDRSALPPLSEAYPGSRPSYVPPSTPLEKVLAGIWAEVLGLERVGIQDNFFDIGGHSLLTIRLVARISDLYKIKLPIRTVFESPTISELAVSLIQSESERQKIDKTSRLLLQLSELTDAEAEEMLAKREA